MIRNDPNGVRHAIRFVTEQLHGDGALATFGTLKHGKDAAHEQRDT